MRPIAQLVTDLNWNSLRTFHFIVEEGSITRAAQRLALRQPTVSLALQRLEDTLGVQLIERNSRHFALTANGEIVAKYCADLFQSVARLSNEIARDQDITTGLLRLSVVSHLQSFLLDESIRLTHQRHPSLTGRIDVANSSAIVRQVVQEATPIGVCLLMKPVVGLECRLLCRENFAIFCGREHPLFGQEEVSIASLQQEPFVAFTCAVDGGNFEPMDMLRSGSNLGQRVVGSSSHLEEVRRLIMSGSASASCPSRQSSRMWRRGRSIPFQRFRVR